MFIRNITNGIASPLCSSSSLPWSLCLTWQANGSGGRSHLVFRALPSAPHEPLLTIQSETHGVVHLVSHGSWHRSAGTSSSSRWPNFNLAVALRRPLSLTQVEGQQRKDGHRRAVCCC